MLSDVLICRFLPFRMCRGVNLPPMLNRLSVEPRLAALPALGSAETACSAEYGLQRTSESVSSGFRSIHLENADPDSGMLSFPRAL